MKEIANDSYLDLINDHVIGGQREPVKTQSEMKKLFVENKPLAVLYKKFGTVMARLSQLGEEVVTMIDGVVETKNVAKADQVVIKGQKGEEYLIGHDKFKARYAVEVAVTDVFKPYEPNGTCIAFEYQGDSMKFRAPWDEDMIVNPGDFLATIDDSVPEVYRIERDAFFKTYKRAVSLNSDDDSVILSTN